jgi:hypothetical protein
MDGHVACMEVMINAYKILVRKSDGKKPLRRSRHRWECNIRTVLTKVGRCGLDSSGSGQGPVVGSCGQSNKPLGSIKCGELCD